MAGLWDRWRRRETPSSGGRPGSPDSQGSSGTPGTPDLPVAEPRPAPGPRPTPRTDPNRARGAQRGTDGEVGADARRTVTPDATGSEPVPDPVRPVTRERLAESMRRRRYRFLVDESGDLCGLWAYRFYSFYVVRGGVLQIRGRWSRQAGIDRLWEILAFADGWNAARRYPKCYVRVHDDGRLHLITEVSVPVASGLTDAQLDHHLAIGLAAGTAVFDELDRRYPDPALAGSGT